MSALLKKSQQGQPVRTIKCVFLTPHETKRKAEKTYYVLFTQLVDFNKTNQTTLRHSHFDEQTDFNKKAIYRSVAKQLENTRMILN